MTSTKFEASSILEKPPDVRGGKISNGSSSSSSTKNREQDQTSPLKSVRDKMGDSAKNKFPSTSNLKQSNERADECAINLDLENDEKMMVAMPSTSSRQNKSPANCHAPTKNNNINNTINNNNNNRVLDPSGSLCYHWSMVVSFAFLYNFWSLSYRFAFREIDFDTVAFWFALDYSADLIYLLDVVINFHTGYLEDGVLQRNIDKIGQHYRECTLFYLDCFCLLPLDILYLSIGFNSILRCTRLVKIYKFWSYSDRTERHTNYPNVFRTFTLVHYILVIFHWNACLFHMISKNKILDIETLYKINDNRCEDILCQYLHAFYWSTLTLTTIGDLPKPRTKGEYFYVTIELFFGLFLFASVLGHVANIVTNVSAARKEFQAKLDAVKTFMRMRRVSDDLQNKVIRWFDYLWVSQKSSDEERSVACLPDRLKAEIAIHVHLDTLKRVDIFQNTEAGFLCELVLRLKPVLFSPGDYVCRKNEVGHEMYIVSKGILEVVTDGEKTVVVATLKAGSYFGEISVLNVGLAGNKRTASVRSVGYSDLFCLNKQDLWDVLKNYPNAEARIRARAEERLSKLGCGGGGGGSGSGRGSNQLQPLPVARSTAPASEEAASSRYYHHHKVGGSQRRSRPPRQQCHLEDPTSLVGDCCSQRQHQRSSTLRRQHQRYKSSLQMMNIMKPAGRRGHNLDQIVPENYYQNQQLPPTSDRCRIPYHPASFRCAHTGRPPAPPPSAVDYDFDDVGDHDQDHDEDGEDASLDYEEEDTMVDCGRGKQPVDSETTPSHHFLPPSSKVEGYGMPADSKPQSPLETAAFQPSVAQKRQPAPSNNNVPDPGIHQTSGTVSRPEVTEPESRLSGAVSLHNPQAMEPASIRVRDRTRSPPDDHRNSTNTDDLDHAIVNACQPEATAVAAASKPCATADSGRSAPSGAQSLIPIANMDAATVASPDSAHHLEAIDTGSAVAATATSAGNLPPVVQPPASRPSSSSISGSCPSGYCLAGSGVDQPATSIEGWGRGWSQQQQPVATCKLPSRRRCRRLHHQHRRHSPPTSKLDCHSYCYCRNCWRPSSVEMEDPEMGPEVEMVSATAAAVASCNDDCELVATYTHPFAECSARQLARSTSRCWPPPHDHTYIACPNDDYQAWSESVRSGVYQHQINRMSNCSRSSRQVQPHQPSTTAIYQPIGPASWIQQAPIGDHHHQHHSSSGGIPCIHIPLMETTTTAATISGGNNNLSASACYQLLHFPSHQQQQQQSVSMSRLDLDAAPKDNHRQAAAAAAAASWQQNPMLAGANSSSYSNLDPAWISAVQARDDTDGRVASGGSSKILAPTGKEQDPASPE